jgi:hypothetical protein
MLDVVISTIATTRPSQSVHHRMVTRKIRVRMRIPTAPIW